MCFLWNTYAIGFIIYAYLSNLKTLNDNVNKKIKIKKEKLECLEFTLIEKSS